MSVAPKIVVYTCGIGGHDWIHRPQDRDSGIVYLRFSDRRGLWQDPWRHMELPANPAAKSARLASRYPKLLPHRVLPDCDVAIWIDGTIMIRDDMTPLVDDFLESGADIAFCPHPSGRTVDQEIDFALKAGRIAETQRDAAEQQRARYKAADVLDKKIVEASVIFYRMGNKTLRDACESWWQELNAYTERDQVSQAFAMSNPGIRIKYWDWHFDDPTNRYLRRIPHRPKKFVKRLRTGAYFLADSHLDYRLLNIAIRGASLIKNGRRKGR